MPSLISIMSTRWWDKLNVVEGSACNCSHLTWKPTSCAMATKVSQITSWVPVCSLTWVQRKKWIPIRLMGCVHTHWKMLAIKWWGGLNYIQSDVENTREDNRKVKKISRAMNQTLAPGPKHDKIWARWVSNIPL
jgi:hypothetical protein